MKHRKNVTINRISEDGMNIYLEIFGYIGTALIIISMMMTSVLKLRIFNMCGSLISLIYAAVCNTWPVAVMNFCLICINMFQTIRQVRQKDKFGHVIVGADDSTTGYFLNYYAADIQKYFPDYSLTPSDGSEIHVIFVNGEIVGVIIGARTSDVYRIEMDYVIPRYRDIKVGQFLFPRLKDSGINTLTSPKSTEAHDKYLARLGFAEEGGMLTRNI